MHLSPCLSGLTGCGCLGIIIIISGRQFETKLEPFASALLTQAIFTIRLYLRERVKKGRVKLEAPPETYLSLKSHLCPHSILFFKGASIAMPDRSFLFLFIHVKRDSVH